MDPQSHSSDSDTYNSDRNARERSSQSSINLFDSTSDLDSQSATLKLMDDASHPGSIGDEGSYLSEEFSCEENASRLGNKKNKIFAADDSFRESSDDIEENVKPVDTVCSDGENISSQSVESPSKLACHSENEDLETSFSSSLASKRRKIEFEAFTDIDEDSNTENKLVWEKSAIISHQNCRDNDNERISKRDTNLYNSESDLHEQGSELKLHGGKVEMISERNVKETAINKLNAIDVSEGGFNKTCELSVESNMKDYVDREGDDGANNEKSDFLDDSNPNTIERESFEEQRKFNSISKNKDDSVSSSNESDEEGHMLTKKNKAVLHSESSSGEDSEENIGRKKRAMVNFSDSDDSGSSDGSEASAKKKLTKTRSKSSSHESDSNELDAVEATRKTKKVSKNIVSDSDSADSSSESEDTNSPTKSGDVSGNKIRQDDESDSDGSDKDELIADIFGGSSEEEGDFEGFKEGDVTESRKNNEEEQKEYDNHTTKRLSDNTLVSDFDQMREKRKGERGRRRKAKDSERLTQNDDAVSELLSQMRDAADQDRQLNILRRPATHKISMLPFLETQLFKADLFDVFLDSGVLNVITEWLAPLPDKSLPHAPIREMFLRLLAAYPMVNSDNLKTSGVGKAVMYLYKHPRESSANRKRAGKLINEWSRPIFNVSLSHAPLADEDRQTRDVSHLMENTRQNRDATDGDYLNESARPGEPGFVMRARVPLPSYKDYVVRPQGKMDEIHTGKAVKKELSLYERKALEFKQKKTRGKKYSAASVSIEGRKMTL